ncbi:MAG: hypothetical protein Q9M91_07305 [Candidatus Dojkabacteria bacterium]|nr:hypothetical protein [Candidatus Dojkabacteria bacterium]MDQ7021595.1 hypothetical protein [Candidatus Dojkabacteria bacterium]
MSDNLDLATIYSYSDNAIETHSDFDDHLAGLKTQEILSIGRIKTAIQETDTETPNEVIINLKTKLRLILEFNDLTPEELLERGYIGDGLLNFFPAVKFETSIKGFSCEAYAIKNDEDRFFVAISVFNDEKENIGFRDFYINSRYGLPVSFGERTIDFSFRLKFPKSFPLEMRSSVDSFIVKKDYKSKSLGRNLWFLSLELAKALGAHFHLVLNDSSKEKTGEGSFYMQFINPAEHIRRLPYPQNIAFPLTARGVKWLRENNYLGDDWEL